MEERYIASVDLGTSKTAVCVARILGQDVQVVYYKETPSQGIRYSYVFNPKKVENGLRDAVSEAQQELRIKIQQVIVGLPRFDVRQETASASSPRSEEDTQIQESEIKSLKSMALESYPLSDSNSEVIYGAVAQSFSTEDSFNEVENDIVGMTAAKLEGNFKVFIGNRRYSINIDNVFNNLGIAIAKKYFTPGITAKAVLKEEQMENGVALIDLGAGVSSVTIFKGKIMRFYAAVPFGGNSVTNDIKSECDISFGLAENIKKAYGACMPNKLSSLGEKIIQINDENDIPTMKVSVKYLSEIITARMKEIIEAMLYEIQLSGYATEDKLRAGVVVTGGGSEMVNCANYIKELSGYSVKIGSPRPFFSCEGCSGAKETSAATSMGMIMAASGDKLLNCTTKPMKRIFLSEEAQTDKDSGIAAAVRVDEAPANVQVNLEDSTYGPANPSIEPSVAAGQEDERSGDEGRDKETDVFDKPTDEQIKEYESAKRKEKKEQKKKKKVEFTWIKHLRDEMGNMFDDMNKEEV